MEEELKTDQEAEPIMKLVPELPPELVINEESWKDRKTKTLKSLNLLFIIMLFMESLALFWVFFMQ